MGWFTRRRKISNNNLKQIKKIMARIKFSTKAVPNYVPNYDHRTAHSFMVPANSWSWALARNIKDFQRDYRFSHSKTGFTHHSFQINFVLTK